VAGYEKPMDEFISSNEGLASRFKQKINFEDYNSNELIKILRLMAKKQDYIIEPNAIKMIKNYFNIKLNSLNIGKDSVSYQEERKSFGNARGARNILEALITKRALRISEIENPTKKDLVIITREDVMNVIPNAKQLDENKLVSAKEELNNLVGLEAVKEKVEGLTSLMRFNKLRQELDLQNQPVNMHMIFTGNPGTGKTTVARLLGQIFKEMGFLSKGHVVEVTRADLISGYSEQTSKNVAKKFREAKGGILFVDEAYSLSNDGKPNGKEAIDAMVSEMENSHDLVVIVAGYPEPMNKFINANEGLASRFKQKLNFEDFDSNQLMQIFEKMIRKQDYKIEASVLPIAKEYFERSLCSGDASKDSILARINRKKFGNARGVRNLLEDIRLENAKRVYQIKEPTKDELTTITKEDIVSVIRNRAKQTERDIKTVEKKHFGFDLNTEDIDQGYSQFKRNIFKHKNTNPKKIENGMRK
jgi:SpoVK/Ycf46/Vps4 family AAA+-type ATPase